VPFRKRSKVPRWRRTPGGGVVIELVRLRVYTPAQHISDRVLTGHRAENLSAHSSTPSLYLHNQHDALRVATRRQTTKGELLWRAPVRRSKAVS
jgi:hypothetical protein